MSSVSPRPYDLCTDIPEVALDPEWRTLVRQAVHTLTAMLKRSQTDRCGENQPAYRAPRRQICADAVLAAESTLQSKQLPYISERFADHLERLIALIADRRFIPGVYALGITHC
jgi:hypothetical protein